MPGCCRQRLLPKPAVRCCLPCIKPQRLCMGTVSTITDSHSFWENAFYSLQSWLISWPAMADSFR